ncbi:hypothetical protein C8R45DRAFT_1145042 [Mycena sanguinolenta]|nr:hypothetical protein C8R45DRAFT_1145042 [Mycena sanguinolenta]
MSTGTISPDERWFRALVVEDNGILQNLLVKWLTTKGYDSRDAVDGRNGVKVYEEEGPFNVVLLDMSMPVLDGSRSSSIQYAQIWLDAAHAHALSSTRNTKYRYYRGVRVRVHAQHGWRSRDAGSGSPRSSKDVGCAAVQPCVHSSEGVPFDVQPVGTSSHSEDAASNATQRLVWIRTPGSRCNQLHVSISRYRGRDSAPRCGSCCTSTGERAGDADALAGEVNTSKGMGIL